MSTYPQVAPDVSGFDIIGDVHGCAHTLELLLAKLGYQKQQGVYRHPERFAIFVGDIVDRGPRIREALHIVKDMMDANSGICLMGNHEYNAIGYTTPIEQDGDEVYLRAHNSRHNRLIAETLEQFAGHPEEWRCFLEWFKTLPLFLEMPGFRVVHACWDQNLISEFKQRYDSNQVSLPFLIESANSKSFAGQFMDKLTRGTDLRLPEGVSIRGRDGYVRSAFRTKFWSRHPKLYRDVVFQPDPLPEELAEQELSSEEKSEILHYGESEPPVFVGHYWLQGTPKPLRPNVACLDYSAVKFGRLVAYSYDGEQALQADKFSWVYVDSK